MRNQHRYKISINKVFDNMKDAREYLGISRSTFKKLISVNLVKKIYE